MDKTLETDSLILKVADENYAKEVALYYQRNREFLQEYEPVREEEFFTIEYQRGILKNEQDKAIRKEALRFYIFKKEEPNIIIGTIGLNNIVWGCFYSCFLGYKLDKNFINQGYMTQAIDQVVEYAFSHMGLHRIEANVLPRNQASIRVLQKCKFVEEGLAKKYLNINGLWEDHIHMVRLNESM